MHVAFPRIIPRIMPPNHTRESYLRNIPPDQQGRAKHTPKHTPESYLRNILRIIPPDATRFAGHGVFGKGHIVSFFLHCKSWHNLLGFAFFSNKTTLLPETSINTSFWNWVQACKACWVQRLQLRVPPVHQNLDHLFLPVFTVVLIFTVSRIIAALLYAFYYNVLRCFVYDLYTYLHTLHLYMYIIM